jgi:hypothetical protein
LQDPSLTQLSSVSFQAAASSIVEQGLSFPSQPVVILKDGLGNAYTSATPVIISAYYNSACTKPAPLSIAGTLSATSDASGIARFSNLNFLNLGSFFLKATAGTVSICSGQFSVSGTQTSSSKLKINYVSPFAVSGFFFNFFVETEDALGNLISASQNPITVSAYSDSSCITAATGTLSGGTGFAYNGQAFFGALTYSNSGTIYLKATSAALTPVCSDPIAIQSRVVSNPTPSPTAAPTTLQLAAIGDSISQAADATYVFNIFNLSNLLAPNPQYSWTTGVSLTSSIINYLNLAISSAVIPKYNSVSGNNQSVIGATAENSSLPLSTQVTALQGHVAQVVTLEIGSNDVCSGGFNQINFATSVQSAVTNLALSANPPKVIIIPSVPNIPQLLTLSTSQGYCSIILPQMCSMVSNQTSLAQLPGLITQANYSLSQIQSVGNTQVVYDNGAVNNVVFSSSIISQDCFHPNVAGQNLFGQTVWNAVGTTVLNLLK